MFKSSFHDGKLSFLGIVDLVQRVVDKHSAQSDLSLESVLDAERWARATADSLIASGN